MPCLIMIRENKVRAYLEYQAITARDPRHGKPRANTALTDNGFYHTNCKVATTNRAGGKGASGAAMAAPDLEQKKNKTKNKKTHTHASLDRCASVYVHARLHFFKISFLDSAWSLD